MLLVDMILLSPLLCMVYMLTMKENREMVKSNPFKALLFCAIQTYFLFAGSIMFLIVLIQEIFLPNYFGDDTGDYY